jgi:hypothetical protein
MCGVPGHWGAGQGIGTELVALLEGIHDLGPNGHETRIPSDMSVGATPLSVIDLACGLDPLQRMSGIRGILTKPGAIHSSTSRSTSVWHIWLLGT